MTAASDPGPEATGDLASLLYLDLRRIARWLAMRQPTGATLQATALVHEAYLRLGDDTRWSGRRHFLAAAARAMRRIVVEHARRRASRRRHDGERVDDDLDDLTIELGAPVEDLLALDEALRRLEGHNERQAMVVMLRYFAGLQDPEVAEVLDVSTRTVRREWHLARLFLAHLMSGAEPA